MKSQKVTSPNMMMQAITRVARPFNTGDQPMTGFLATRSARTPPTREKTTCGSINASVTQVRLSADELIS